MVKKAVQRGRSDARRQGVPLRYVEPLSDARTKLADFFTILLQHLHDELQMDAVVLEVALAATDMIELLSPVHFEAGPFLRQDHPTQASADACQGLRVECLAFGVPRMAEIDELRELQPVFPGCEPQ